MIADEMKALFDDLKKELLSIKTDLTIIKYDLEQLSKKVQLPPVNQETERDFLHQVEFGDNAIVEKF